MRKVKGELNPADFFTKFLPSKEKVHSLVRMFGCEYRSGRAEAAPLLRPLSETLEISKNINSSDQVPILPHLHSQADIDKLFPVMEAPPAGSDQDFVPQSDAELWVVRE